MPKSTGQKLKILYLKDILEQETDETHGLTAERISELLLKHGIEAQRRALYDDFNLLEEYGMKIHRPSGKDTKYRLEGRRDDEFELAEIKLLLDAIQSCKYLSEGQTRTLINKLEKQCSRFEAKSLHRDVIVTGRVKSQEQSKHQEKINTIHRAILGSRQISFKYFKRDMGKKKVYRLGQDGRETRETSPYKLIYTDDNYYLLAYTGTKFVHFRVDRMETVREIEKDRVGAEEYKKLDLKTYTKRTFGMFGGEPTRVTMRFQKDLVGPVMDRFGYEVFIMPEDEEHFHITVPIVVSWQFYGWLFGLGAGAEIVGPQEVREGMAEVVEKIRALYQADDSKL